MSKFFRVSEIDLPLKNNLYIEKVVLTRLSKDPFFKVNSLVVWDLEELEAYKETRPSSSHAIDIRYNKRTEKWERRITTQWKVQFGNTSVLKEQGLDLDNNKGFHKINRGLTKKVRPDSFQDVDLNYPIFINHTEDAQVQIDRLKQTYLTNLYYIYDPFSWAARRNERFRKKFQKPVAAAVQESSFPFKKDEWFDEVLTHLIHDLATIKVLSVDEIYKFEVLSRIKNNNNILGTELDPLNWHTKKKRSIKSKFKIKNKNKGDFSFENPHSARFVLIDAYRRYEKNS